LDAPVLLTPLEVGLCLLVLRWIRLLRWWRWMWVRGRRRCWSPTLLGVGCWARWIFRWAAPGWLR
jgi:hypothetical protein